VKNPWTKKNPFMSMWLSGANAIAGAARGRATAEARRQAKTLMTAGTKQMVDFWTGASMTSRPRRKKKSR
jgi:hypothetical protein